MASRLVSVSKNIFGKAFYSNLWIAFSSGLVSQVIGYTKYEGYFDLYWIIMNGLLDTINDLALSMLILKPRSVPKKNHGMSFPLTLNRNFLSLKKWTVEGFR